MLRTLIIALALGAPGMAGAQQFPQSAVGIDVVGDDGTVIGRVEHVERDANGRIVAAELSNLEPGNAPYASDDLVAENDRNALMSLVRDRRDDRNGAGIESSTRTR